MILLGVDVALFHRCNGSHPKTVSLSEKRAVITRMKLEKIWC
jgi:hypothetical protein